MINFSLLKQEQKNGTIIKLAVALGVLVLASIIVSQGMEFHISAILARLGIVDWWTRRTMAISIVDAIVYGGGWLASLEFPIISPFVGYLTYYLAVYGYWPAVWL